MSVLKVDNLSKLNQEKIIKFIDKKGFIIIRGLFERKLIRNKLKKLKKKKIINSKPSLSGNTNQIKKNFHKLCIGAASREILKENAKIYRLHRIIYNPLWCADIYGLKSIFIKFCKIRNFLLGLKSNFCITKRFEKNLWSATRILQYPIGGGHMSPHSDFVVKKINNKNKITKFYQLILNLTEYQKDFNSGGAYIKFKNKKIFLEDKLQSGDILIYHGNSIHGVDEIDPHKKLNLIDFNGRIILMNSLYQYKY